MIDTARIRHRQGPARVINGVPFSDHATTLSLLPGAAVGHWLARQAPLVHGRLLDLGCGNQPFKPWYEPMAKEVVAADFVAGPGVMQVDLTEPLPFPDASFDTVMCTSVLEHVENSGDTVDEIRRVLRPGGHALITVPFLYPTHEAPYDFTRWTHHGLSGLMRRHGLEIIDLGAQGGPLLLAAHYVIRGTAGALEAAGQLLGRFGRVVDNPLTRALLWAPQEFVRDRVGTRLTTLSRLASLGYMVSVRRPADDPA